MVQAYLAEVQQGDRRVILIDGEPRGVLNRVAGESDHRCNMHVGAQAEQVPLSEQDRLICDAIGPFLREHGMVFTGIDIIGGKLTEINALISVNLPPIISIPVNTIPCSRKKGPIASQISRSCSLNGTCSA